MNILVEHFGKTGVSVCLDFVEFTMNGAWIEDEGNRRLMMLQTAILVRLYGFAAISYICIVSALVLQTKSSE